jgi:ABC-2 type transport system ATP-binding protein
MRIELQNVDIDFPIYDARTRSLKHRVLGLGPPRVGSAGHHRVLVCALRGITMTLRDGTAWAWSGATVPARRRCLG